jgi:hypothetical protein
MSTPSLTPTPEPARPDLRVLGRVLPVVLVAGAVATSATLVLGGRAMGVAAAVGATLAAANWLAIRWIVSRVLSGDARTRAALLSLLGAKMGLLGAVVYLCLGPLGLDPAGLGAGLSALVAGIVLGGLGASASEPHRASKDASAPGGPSRAAPRAPASRSTVSPEARPLEEP